MLENNWIVFSIKKETDYVRRLSARLSCSIVSLTKNFASIGAVQITKLDSHSTKLQSLQASALCLYSYIYVVRDGFCA